MVFNVLMNYKHVIQNKLIIQIKMIVINLYQKLDVVKM